MPSVKLIKIQNTIQDTLTNLKVELLPKEISENSEARWIMQFDSLNIYDEHTENIESIDEDINYQNITRINYIVADAIQPQINLYFSSLFHIGRLWQTSEFALSDLKELQETKNIKESTKNILKTFKNNLSEMTYNDAEIFLRDLCELGANQHNQNLKKAQYLWNVWLNEVKTFHASFSDYKSSNHNKDSIFYNAIRLIGLRPSKLYQILKDEGVIFKNEDHFNEALTLSNRLSLSILILALSKTDSPRFLYDEISPLLYLYIKTIQAETKNPIKLALLHKKYGDSNPFDEYVPGRNPASEQLKLLINENKLTNDEYSPWLDSWFANLKEEPYYYEKLPSFVVQSEELITNLVLSADSTIKKSIDKETKDILQTWNEYIQEIFENNWAEPFVLAVTRGITESYRTSEKINSTVNQLQDILGLVVNRLNFQGYNLYSLYKERIEAIIYNVGEEEQTNVKIYDDESDR